MLDQEKSHVYLFSSSENWFASSFISSENDTGLKITLASGLKNIKTNHLNRDLLITQAYTVPLIILNILPLTPDPDKTIHEISRFTVSKDLLRYINAT